MRVIIGNISMYDFVTSDASIVEFDTRKECEEYVKNSEKFHPGRFSYRIDEKKTTTNKYQQEDMRPVHPVPVMPLARGRYDTRRKK